jgi:hypothetical protein
VTQTVALRASTRTGRCRTRRHGQADKQFRERDFVDALANSRGVEARACRLRQKLRVGRFSPSGLGDDSRHRPFERDMKCVVFVLVALLRQTNRRFGLRAGRRDQLVGLLARGFDLPARRRSRLPNRPAAISARNPAIRACQP